MKSEENRIPELIVHYQWRLLILERNLMHYLRTVSSEYERQRAIAKCSRMIGRYNACILWLNRNLLE